MLYGDDVVVNVLLDVDPHRRQVVAPLILHLLILVLGSLFTVTRLQYVLVWGLLYLHILVADVILLLEEGALRFESLPLGVYMGTSLGFHYFLLHLHELSC